MAFLISSTQRLRVFEQWLQRQLRRYLHHVSPPIWRLLQLSASMTSYVPSVCHLEKQCPSDPLSMWLLKECASTISPFLTRIFNLSLTGGDFPWPWKHAIVNPLLKKAGGDNSIVSSYRPVTNLPHISKILARIVHRQVISHLEELKLLPNFKSAYRPGHSTEMGVLMVYSDLIDAIWSGKFALLSLLDLTAAFDTVNHNNLLPYPASSQRRGANSVWPRVLRTHHADSTWPTALAAHSSKDRFQAMITRIQGTTWVSTSLHKNYCVEVLAKRCLRSTSHRCLVIPSSSKAVLFDERSFAIEGPSLWNHLPDIVKEAGSIKLFKQRLKTHLFGQSFEILAFFKLCNSALDFCRDHAMAL